MCVCFCSHFPYKGSFPFGNFNLLAVIFLYYRDVAGCSYFFFGTQLIVAYGYIKVATLRNLICSNWLHNREREREGATLSSIVCKETIQAFIILCPLLHYPTDFYTVSTLLYFFCGLAFNWPVGICLVLLLALFLVFWIQVEGLRFENTVFFIWERECLSMAEDGQSRLQKPLRMIMMCNCPCGSCCRYVTVGCHP